MLRVDTVPWYIKPFFLLYGYFFGLLMYLYIKLLALTCKIKFTGAPLPKDSAAVYCIWHRDLVLYFAAFSSVRRQVWMNHPAWYMKPVHVLLYLTGVGHICLGSSGNNGKEALEKVIAYLKEGYSTTIAVDGPAGPPLVLKPGVLVMGYESKLPVVPLRFICALSSRAGGWDRKLIPGLFSTITVDVGQCVYPDINNFQASADAITGHLNGE